MEQFRKFHIDLEKFIENLKILLEENKLKQQELLKQKEKTYRNFVKPLAMMENALEEFFSPLSHINSVKNSSKTQEVYTNALPLITEYSTQLSQNLEIYNAYKEIQEKELDTLDFAQKRVLELNILGFELSGAHLEEEQKKRLQEINLRKSELSNQFSQNLLDATNAYEYIIEDEKDLEGLAPSDIENAKFDDNGNIKYKFTLQMPSYLAYMTYGKNAKIREELYRAYVSRAPENEKIIDELLALRFEMSQILGFKNFSEYSLASKMAQNTESVINFLENLLHHSQKQAKEEFQELSSFANKKLQSFDSAYYSELLRKEKYDIDEELYKPYFEQQSVIDGTFNFLEKLFGIKFIENNEVLWDEKAKSYNLYVNEKLRARLYLDLEARKDKRGGAWMDNFQTHFIDLDAKERLASAVVVCNFAPSSDTTPSLLRHDDVVTFFHEMGHAIHHMLSDISECEVSGVNGVEWDAVEFPSQFLENFAYESKVLKMFAIHYETKEVISDEMIQKLIKSKNFLSASAMLRQLEFSLFDFKVHSRLYKGEEIQILLDDIREKTALIQPPKYNKFQNGFAHIFAGGYAAGYYSYKWAEVLSADLFFSIVDEGIFDSKTAKKYFEIVLEGGGSKSMALFFRELQGREPNTNSLLRLNGIVE